MKHIKRSGTVRSTLFALFFCTLLNTAILNAAEAPVLADPETPAISWLPENSSVNPASSTSAIPTVSGESVLVAEGKASYYSSNLHGKKTASGESLNHTRFTAAHRYLPFGTSVRVINLDNGKNVVVRINDRGPFLKGRIIDVSRAAAKEIGLLGTGTAKVRIEAFN
ncbi:MAG: septal ring lytic transglycosylase RlpA family protein [Chlorobium sp.]|nr:MAG: septal ring lytic transglycosylase RlpA family protein [Chlorobium sp.]